jgi:hypothetical protein
MAYPLQKGPKEQLKNKTQRFLSLKELAIPSERR